MEYILIPCPEHPIPEFWAEPLALPDAPIPSELES